MAIKTTRWRPSTCACVLEYDWDTEVSEDARAHTQRRVVSRCAAHQADADAGFLTRVTFENRKVGQIIARLGEVFPALSDPDVAAARVSFRATRDADGARVVEVSFPAATAVQRTALQTWCDTRFGAGRLVVGA